MGNLLLLSSLNDKINHGKSKNINSFDMKNGNIIVISRNEDIEIDHNGRLTRIPTTNKCKVSISPNGSFIAYWSSWEKGKNSSSSSLKIRNLDWEDDGKEGLNDLQLVQVTSIDEKIVWVGWHPYSVSYNHLFVLQANGSIKVFNVARKGEMQTHLRIKHPDDATLKFIDASFGNNAFGGDSHAKTWAFSTLFILAENYDVLSICPILPFPMQIEIEMFDSLVKNWSIHQDNTGKIEGRERESFLSSLNTEKRILESLRQSKYNENIYFNARMPRILQDRIPKLLGPFIINPDPPFSINLEERETREERIQLLALEKNGIIVLAINKIDRIEFMVFSDRSYPILKDDLEMGKDEKDFLKSRNSKEQYPSLQLLETLKFGDNDDIYSSHHIKIKFIEGNSLLCYSKSTIWIIEVSWMGKLITNKEQDQKFKSMIKTLFNIETDVIVDAVMTATGIIVYLESGKFVNVNTEINQNKYPDLSQPLLTETFIITEAFKESIKGEKLSISNLSEKDLKEEEKEIKSSKMVTTANIEFASKKFPEEFDEQTLESLVSYIEKDYTQLLANNILNAERMDKKSSLFTDILVRQLNWAQKLKDFATLHRDSFNELFRKYLYEKERYSILKEKYNSIMILEIQSQKNHLSIDGEEVDESEGKDSSQKKLLELKDRLRGLEIKWKFFESFPIDNVIASIPSPLLSKEESNKSFLINDRQLTLIHDQLSKQFELIQNLIEQLRKLSLNSKGGLLS